jgi:hypothetical protein
MALILLRAFRHRENKDPTVKRLRFGCVQILAASERHRERRQPAVPVAPRGSDTSGLCRVLGLARNSCVGYWTRRQSPTLSLVIIRRCG